MFLFPRRGLDPGAARELEQPKKLVQKWPSSPRVLRLASKLESDTVLEPLLNFTTGIFSEFDLRGGETFLTISKILDFGEFGSDFRDN